MPSTFFDSRPSRRTPTGLTTAAIFWLPLISVSAQLLTPTTTSPSLSQPARSASPGTFQVVGNSIVSAQQLFLGTSDKVYILDKVENNPGQIDGRPVWGEEWTLSNDHQRAMNVVTNAFCAGGNVMGNGTWLSIGGNQAVVAGGLAASVQDGTQGPYFNADGRRSIRMLTPCDDNSCQWSISPLEIDQRWYPTVETLDDGSVIIIGGCRWGGFVNDASQSVTTYEFFPSRGEPITLQILEKSLPANLYPLVWVLPSGKLLIQANWATSLLDLKTKVETPIADMPEAVRTYPASGGSVMLPLTPANSFTAKILFCGGSNVPSDQWTAPSFVAVSQPASKSCVRITPDVSPSYEPDDPLPEQRVMGSLVLLPNGKVLCLNGARTGTAGYGTESWAIGQSYADDPVMIPAIYDPDASLGNRWTTAGLSPTNIPRMYHSVALLLPDGSVFVSGSNPNADFASGTSIKYPTEYRTEMFFPPYYNKRRPEPKGLPTKLGYGGPYFNVVLSDKDLDGNVNNIAKASVVLLRPGYATHAMTMGQRSLTLASTHTGYNANNTGVLHVSQLPPNPSVFPPGPALLFVVVNDIPSIGIQVMVGSGELGTQKVNDPGKAPSSSMVSAPSNEEDPKKKEIAKVNGAQRSQWNDHQDLWGPLGIVALGVGLGLGLGL